MARPLRKQIEGGWYHVMSRGTDRRAIFTEDRECIHYLELLENLVEGYRFIIHAYVLMGNHYHLIVQTPEGNLSAGMQWLNTSYSMWFNKRHERVGPLLQGRYKSVWIENSAWAYEVGIYLHLNPVRIKAYGLDKQARRTTGNGLRVYPVKREDIDERLRLLRGYKWSSYRAYAGYDKEPEWLTTGGLLGRVADRASERRMRYRTEVCRFVKEGCEESPSEKLKDKLALGSEEFRKRIRTLIREGGREYSFRREARLRCVFEEVVRAVEELRGDEWSEFCRRRGDWGKGLVLWGAKKFSGLTLAQVGRKAGGMDYTAVAMAIKRFESRASESRKLKHYQRCLAKKCEK